MSWSARRSIASRTSAPKPAWPSATGSRATAWRSSQVAPLAVTWSSMARSERTAMRDATPALRVVELAQLDDRARRAVAGGVEIGKLDVVGPAVDAVDDSIGRALQLIVETAIDQAADDRDIQALASEHIARRGSLDAAFGQAAVDALDDVAALAELAQASSRRPRPSSIGPARAGARDRRPSSRRNRPTLSAFERIRLTSGIWREIDDAVSIGVAGELPVELGPALGVDLALERAADVEIAARPQLLRHQVLGAGAHALLDVVARDDEVLAVVGDAAHDDVDVGMLRCSSDRRRPNRAWCRDPSPSGRPARG